MTRSGTKAVQTVAYLPTSNVILYSQNPDLKDIHSNTSTRVIPVHTACHLDWISALFLASLFDTEVFFKT
jgi:hypothetical protein